jgi:CheY-like chemotaxis protein
MDENLAKQRFLVVEDEMLVLLMIEDMLGDLGCEVVASAATAEQALGLIAAGRFDSAMLDMNLKGDKSDEVAQALVARGVPFIFCSGSSALDVAPEFQDRPFLRKPFSFAELADGVAKLNLARV